MLNKNGNTEDLKEFHSNGEASYQFYEGLCDYSYEYTFDKNGNILTYKNSDDYSYECTRDKFGNVLTFKNSEDYSSEFTYDKNGNELTFKNSEGVKRGFKTPVEETKTKIMLNKNGNTENLKEYHENGGVSYRFKKLDDYSFEYTYDENGDELTFKDSNGYSCESTFDKNGNELTFKNSEGVKRGFETPVK
tara:strand:+ start:180 stop:752 length:573 start_codon:yes stop_codon:yes gene_type:complete